MRYVKLYESMKNGSLAAVGGPSLWFWPHFLLEASWEGEVLVHPDVLSKKWMARPDDVRAAIATWESPDPASSTPDMEGRRIVRLDAHKDWGWKVVNWEKYRDDEDNDRTKAQGRARQARYRDKMSNANDELFPVTNSDVTQNHRDGDDTEDRGQRTEDKKQDRKAPIAHCPHEKIVQLYHEILPELPKVVEWTEKRRGYLNARWRSDPKRQTVDYWRNYFEFVRASDWLMGRVAPSPGRSQFRADLEYLIKPENFIRILERKYHHD